MSTWMYGEDMDKVVERRDKLIDLLGKERTNWENLAIQRNEAMNLLIDRLLDEGNASWLLTHPNETIRIAALGKYSSRKT